MFEKYVEEYKNLLNELVPEADLVTIDQLSKSPNFPQEIRQYLNAYIAINLSKDFDKIFDDKDFDLSENLNKKKNDYLLEFAQYFKIERSDLLEIISSSVEVRFNYMIRPQITLATLIFDSELPFDKNKDLSKHMFFEYSYLLNDIDLNDLNKDAFIEKLKDVDSKFIYDLEPSNFIKLLFNIFKLFSYDGLKKDVNAIPIEALIVFFDEKEIAPLVEKLADMVNENEQENITKDELINLISEISGVDHIDIEEESVDTEAEEEVISESNSKSNKNVVDSINDVIDADLSTDDYDLESVSLNEVEEPLKALSSFLNDEPTEVEDQSIDNIQEGPKNENDSDPNIELEETDPYSIIESDGNIEENLEKISDIFGSSNVSEIDDIELTEANTPLQKEIQELVGDID